MKHFIIDTNAILRFLLNDIPEQKAIVEKILVKAKNNEIKLTVPQIVIFELNFILDKYYHFSKESIIETLKVVVSSDYLQIESKDVFITAFFLYSTTSNSFVDCFLMGKVQIEKAEFFTFDAKLKKEGTKEK